VSTKQQGGQPADRRQSGERKTASKTQIAAVRLLARREHSVKELKRKLEAKGHAAEEVDRVVADLGAKKLVSDERFTEAYIAHHARRGQGPVRIRAELRQQGASDDVIEAALARSEVDWTALAIETRRRKFGDRPPGGAAERAKQARFLQYRGFSTEQIRAALSGRNDSVTGIDPSPELDDPEWSA
jgi:regulatory protein